MKQSKKYSLNKKDLESILVGLSVALAGAALTYVSETVGKIDFGSYTPIVVALCSVFVNTARKYIAGK